MFLDVFLAMCLILGGILLAGGLAVGFGLLQRGKVKQDRELIVTRAETDEARHRSRILQIQRDRELDALIGKQLPQRSSAVDEDEETAFISKRDIEQPPDEPGHWGDEKPETADATVVS